MDMIINMVMAFVGMLLFLCWIVALLVVVASWGRFGFLRMFKTQMFWGSAAALALLTYLLQVLF